jgi:hypothetical protein
MPKKLVTIAYIHPNMGVVGEAFARSMALNAAELGPERLEGIISMASPDPKRSRNEAIELFLEKYQSEWLLWWDTDMQLESDAALRLLEAARRNNAFAATCLGFMQRNDIEIQGINPGVVPVPNFFTELETGEYGMPIVYEKGSEFFTDATGFGFTLVHRRVYELMRRHGLEPFHEDAEDGLKHDLNFWRKAASFPIFGQRIKPLYVTSINSSHQKHYGLDESSYDRAWGIEQAPVETEA